MHAVELYQVQQPIYCWYGTALSWRSLGARSTSEAYGYYLASLRRSWGVLAVREMARHRLRRVVYVGAGHRPRAQQAWEDAGGRGLWRHWPHASHAEFHAFEARRAGAIAAGVSARRGAPRR